MGYLNENMYYYVRIIILIYTTRHIIKVEAQNSNNVKGVCFCEYVFNTLDLWRSGFINVNHHG